MQNQAKPWVKLAEVKFMTEESNSPLRMLDPPPANVSRGNSAFNVKILCTCEVMRFSAIANFLFT